MSNGNFLLLRLCLGKCVHNLYQESSIYILYSYTVLMAVPAHLFRLSLPLDTLMWSNTQGLADAGANIDHINCGNMF